MARHDLSSYGEGSPYSQYSASPTNSQYGAPLSPSSYISTNEYFTLLKTELRITGENVLMELESETNRRIMAANISPDLAMSARDLYWEKGLVAISRWGDQDVADEVGKLIGRASEIDQILKLALGVYVRALHPTSVTEYNGYRCLKHAMISATPSMIEMMRCFLVTMAEQPFFKTSRCRTCTYFEVDQAFFDVVRLMLYRLFQGRVSFELSRIEEEDITEYIGHRAKAEYSSEVGAYKRHSQIDTSHQGVMSRGEQFSEQRTRDANMTSSSAYEQQQMDTLPQNVTRAMEQPNRKSVKPRRKTQPPPPPVVPPEETKTVKVSKSNGAISTAMEENGSWALDVDASSSSEDDFQSNEVRSVHLSNSHDREIDCARLQSMVESSMTSATENTLNDDFPTAGEGEAKVSDPQASYALSNSMDDGTILPTDSASNIGAYPRPKVSPRSGSPLTEEGLRRHEADFAKRMSASDVGRRRTMPETRTPVTPFTTI